MQDGLDAVAGTRERILDAAEQLFSRAGFNGASLRPITTDAGANLAAVHYHFGSKEALLKAVVARRIDPVNQQRLALLAEYEQAGGGALSVEEVVHAFVQPVTALWHLNIGSV